MRFRPNFESLCQRIVPGSTTLPYDPSSPVVGPVMIAPTDPASSPYEVIYQPGVGEIGTGGPTMLPSTNPASSPSPSAPTGGDASAPADLTPPTAFGNDPVYV